MVELGLVLALFIEPMTVDAEARLTSLWLTSFVELDAVYQIGITCVYARLTCILYRYILQVTYTDRQVCLSVMCLKIITPQASIYIVFR